MTGHVIPGNVRTGNSAKTDFAGEMTAGSFYDFTGTYSIAPVCTVSDTSATPTAASGVVSGTAPTFKLTVHGSSGHHLAYVCVGRN